jgi:hypothetical protein
MGNGALAIGPKLPRPSSTLPSVLPGARDSSFQPDVKRTSPSYYEIVGPVCSDIGCVSKVEISTDGGKDWAEAAWNP